MKTVAWTPSQDENAAEFNLEDEVIFSSSSTKLDKRVSMITALLSGAHYATRGLSFEIRSMTQETLAVFEPNIPVKGYPSIVRSLMEAAGHLDHHANTIAHAAATSIKVDVIQLYERGVFDGSVATKKHYEETGNFDIVPGSAPGQPAAQDSDEVSDSTLGETAAPAA